MRRNSVKICLFVSLAVLFVLICAIPFQPGKDIRPHAFICGNSNAKFSIDDTTALFTADTVRPGDTVMFVGLTDTTDQRIAGKRWEYGDGKADTTEVAFHPFETSGIYHVVYFIYSTVGDTLSDTVIVCVNNPPEAVTRLSPADESQVTATPELSWEGIDSDAFDTKLSYCVFLINKDGSHDTIMNWSDARSVTPDRTFNKGEEVRWIVITRDSFGAILASDTGRFSIQLSNDATLSTLALSGYSLVPEFTPDVALFTGTVENTVHKASLTIAARDTEATIRINDAAVAKTTTPIELDLPELVNKFTIVVTAADGTSTRTYSLFVVRYAVNNALLSNLTVSTGEFTPEFSPSVYAYTTTLIKGTSSLTITPTAMDGAATVKVNGKVVKSGDPTDAIALKPDESNEIAIEVTAQDEVTRNSYKIATVFVNGIPAIPSDVKAASQDTSKILLTWKDNASDETGFDIARSTSKDGVSPKHFTVDANAASFTDTGLESGTEYFYTIKAFNDDKSSEYSAVTSAITKVALDLSVGQSIGGTVTCSPDAKIFDRGATIVITATPAPGYHFVGWAGDAGGNDNPLTVVIDSSRKIAAYFTDRPPTLQGIENKVITAGAVLEFTVTGSDPDGDAVTLSAGTLPTGATFDGATGKFKWTPTQEQMGMHTVIFTATAGELTATDSVVINVSAIPIISSQPANVTLCSGLGATFTVAATGTAPLKYQWRKAMVAITGATAATFTIANVKTTDAGSYDCVVSNSAGNDTSTAATLTVNVPPSFTSQPMNLAKCIGENASFTVAASGSAPLTYQWKKNGVNIDGANSATFTIVNAAAGDAARYSCAITNGCGNILSNEATLTMSSPSTAPTSLTASANSICKGTPVVLTLVDGSLGTGASWKWYSGSCGGTLIPSSNTTTITVNPTTTTTYYVRAESGCNITPCASATITINTGSVAATGITADKALPICVGDSVTLTLTGGMLSSTAKWMWYSGSCDNGTYEGTGTQLKVKPAASIAYYVRAEEECGNTDCKSISVTVNTLSTPPTSIIAGSSEVCPGSSTTLTVNGGSLGTGATWRWYRGGTCGTGIASGTGVQITVSPTATTTYYVRAEGPCNTTNCASATVTLLTQSTPATSASANPSQVCSGSPTTLSVNGGTLGSGATWVWYAGGCGTGTAVGTGAHITVFPTAATTYYVRAEGTCYVTPCVNVTVTLNTPSTAPTSASANPQQVCSGSPTTLSVTGGSIGTGATWVWYAGGCGTGTSIGSGAQITVSPTVATTYYVRAEGTCNNTPCANVAVSMTAQSTPPASASANPSQVCSGSPTTLSVTGGSLGAGAEWVWYAGGCGTGTAVGKGLQISVSPLVETTYYVRAEGGCGGTTTCKSVTVAVNALSDISSATLTANNDPICQGSEVTLTLTGGTLAPGALWTWYKNGCGTLPIVHTGTTFTDKPTATTTYFVRAEGGCGGTTDCKKVTVTVNTPSTPPTTVTAEPATICPGASTTISLTGGSLAPGASWVWYKGQCGGTIYFRKTTDLSITDNPTSDTKYYVRAEGDGACTPMACSEVAVTVNTLSTDPTGVSASPGQICLGQSTALSVKGTLGTGASWKWYEASSMALVGTGAPLTISPTTTTSYIVKAEGLCNTTNSAIVSVTVNTKSDITGAYVTASSSAICPGERSVLTLVGGTLGTGAKWYWYEGNCGVGLLPIDSGSSIIVTPQVTTSYYVKAEKGICGNTDCVPSVTGGPVVVTVYTSSKAPEKATFETCPDKPKTIRFTGGSLGTGAVWKWYPDDTYRDPIATGDSMIVKLTPNDVGGKVYYVRAENGLCNPVITLPAAVSVSLLNLLPSTAPSRISGDWTCEGADCTSHRYFSSIHDGTLGQMAAWKWYEVFQDGKLQSIGTDVTSIQIVRSYVPYAIMVRAEAPCDTTKGVYWNPPQ